jgi:hypothetical protein
MNIELSKPEPEYSAGLPAGLNAAYWYLDENKHLRKYERCSMCRKGPFKQTDVDVLFVKTDDKIPYCVRCHKDIFRPGEVIRRATKITYSRVKKRKGKVHDIE